MAKSRAEIDKEIMYRKIMPSAARSGGAVTSADPGSTAAAAAPSSETPSPFSAPGRKTAGLQLPESQDMILVNLMEDLVLSRLDATLMRFNCCKCNKCKKDIAAIALNKLTPKYAVISRGDEVKKTETENQYGTEVTGSLVQAIMLVKKEPRH